MNDYIRIDTMGFFPEKIVDDETAFDAIADSYDNPLRVMRSLKNGKRVYCPNSGFVFIKKGEQ